MNWNLLKELCDTPGLPGAEEKTRAIFRREIKKFTSKIRTDAMGNIIAHIPGKGPKLMLDAHMDEVGFIVNHIDDDGFLRVVTLGGVDGRAFAGQRVVIWGKKPLKAVVGVVPPHIAEKDKDKVIPVEDCFIDAGISASKVKAQVQIGDLVTFDSDCIETEDCLMGKAFDDRAGMFMIIEGLKAAKKISCDLYLVGAVQEEGGLRGAGPAAFGIEPDLALSLEGTIANDIPGAPAYKRLGIQGKGPELRFCDARFVADRAWMRFLIELAKSKKIPYQVIAKKVGSTNAAQIQVTGVGTRTTALAIPVRYIHSAQCVVRKSDIEAGVRLTAAVIEKAASFKYEE